MEDIIPIRIVLPNQKISWEHSGNKVGNFCNRLIIVGIMAGIYMSRLLRETFHNAAHNIFIAVFGETIPLLVRIMWALPMHYQGHFPQYTQDIIMEFLFKIHYYLPTLYSFVIFLHYMLLYLLTLIHTPLIITCLP